MTPQMAAIFQEHKLRAWTSSHQDKYSG